MLMDKMTKAVISNTQAAELLGLSDGLYTTLIYEIK
jgi:hypothetical protein